MPAYEISVPAEAEAERRSGSFLPHLAFAAGALLAAARVSAASYEAGSLKIDWLNDVELSGGIRQGYAALQGPGPVEADDDQSGIEGRADWRTELGLDSGALGFRASMRAAVGDLYRRLDPRSSRLLLARVPEGGAYLEPYDPTIEHSELEFLDTFLHGSFDLGGDQRLSLRLGRFALVWGESLYFPENGVAAATPLDFTLPARSASYYSDRMLIPTAKAWFSWDPGSRLAIEGYYQFEHRADRVSEAFLYPGSSVQVSSADTGRLRALGSYGLRLAPGEALTQSGAQFGLAVRTHWSGTDLGLYAERYDATSPALVLRGPTAYRVASPTTGRADRVFVSGIESYGLSASARYGDVNLAAELSARRDMPFLTGGIVMNPGGSSSVAAFPRGDSMQAQLSWDYSMPPTAALPGGAEWTTELAANARLSGENLEHLLPGRTRLAAAVRTVLELRFPQVLPRLDLSVPISFGWGLAGRSSTDPLMNSGTGSLGLGVTAQLDQVWRVGVNGTHYINPDRALYLPYSPTSAADPLGAGDFLSVFVGRTF